MVLSIFWSGKRDLVARCVLYHPLDCGGFSVVSVKFKVQSLLVQWVRQSLACPNGWVYLMTYWFHVRFNATPFKVFSQHCLYSPSSLPPFYLSLPEAWFALEGVSLSSDLVLGSGTSGSPFPVSFISCKSCYLLLLELNPHSHIVSKNLPLLLVLWTGL